MFVSWEQINPLFNCRIQSGSKENMKKLHTVRATIFVSTECTDGHKNVWNIIQKTCLSLCQFCFQPFDKAMDITKVKMFNHNILSNSKQTFISIDKHVYQRKCESHLWNVNSDE